MITKNTWIAGIKAGWDTTWILGRIVFPITIIVSLLTYTPVIDWIIAIFTPLMKGIGLPGEAAIPLALGNLLNLYAAIGAILSLDLSVKHVFILAIMLSFSHNLIIETAVAKKIGINIIVPIAVRVSLALLSALLITYIWQGGTEQAQYGMIAAVEQVPDTWIGIMLLAFKKAMMGIWQIVLIVFPLMIGIQVLKDIKAIEYLAKWSVPLTKILGLSSGRTSVSLLAGIIFGLAYGAGVIIQSAKEENLSRKDLYLLTIFLVSSHAVVEDTVIFIPLGIPVFPLLIIRMLVAFIVTMVTAIAWKAVTQRKEFTTKGVCK